MTLQKYFIYLDEKRTFMAKKKRNRKKKSDMLQESLFAVKFWRVSLFKELKNCDRLNRDFQDCSFFCLSMMAPLSCCLKEANWQKSAFCTTAILQLFFLFFQTFYRIFRLLLNFSHVERKTELICKNVKGTELFYRFSE